MSGSEFKIEDVLFDGPAEAEWTLCLAHGAGAPMDSPFMQEIAERLAAEGVQVCRFEFPYMRERRTSGKKKPPNREPILLESWERAFDLCRQRTGGGGKLAVGGKSMGGRIASMIADGVEADAVVCLGYPFHPPGKPKRLRTAHLETIETPTLICQGERDPFGKQEEVESYPLSDAVSVFWATDGDHDLKPRKASGITHSENISAISDRILQFLYHKHTSGIG